MALLKFLIIFLYANVPREKQPLPTPHPYFLHSEKVSYMLPEEINQIREVQPRKVHS